LVAVSDRRVAAAENFKPDNLDISGVFDKWIQASDAYPIWSGQTGFFRYNDYYSSFPS